MFTGSMGKIAVFCSYAREDEAIRARLAVALAALRREHVIDDWYDNRINPGARWNKEIQAALDRTRLMLFIVTPHLMASNYIAEVEIPKALERELHGECRVVPVMAVRTDWDRSPLARFQALPGGGKWLDEQANDDAAFAQISDGIRHVCKNIIDWENPYKRSRVGDWCHSEQTTVLDDGRSLTGEGTEELVAKTAEEATIVLEMAVNGEVRRQEMTIPLAQPLEDRMADMLRQTGVAVPRNLEYSMGPAQYADEVINIGGCRYETVRVQRAMTMAQRGERFEGFVTNWRSIDVPLFGVVKGEGRFPGMRQYQVLLGFGHGDAATRKPRITGEGGVSAGSGTASRASSVLVDAGHWQMQMNAFGTVTPFDLMLYPDGSFQGWQYTMGMPMQRQGRWFFDPGSNTLIFQVIAMIMGNPMVEDAIHMQITGADGPTLWAQDALGRQFQLQRIG